MRGVRRVKKFSFMSSLKSDIKEKEKGGEKRLDTKLQKVSWSLLFPASIHHLALNLPSSLLDLSGTTGAVLILRPAGGNKPESTGCFGVAI